MQKLQQGWNLSEFKSIGMWGEASWFTDGNNTLLRFRYERLRGFCEVCGMLTHDSGACHIQNGGDEHQWDDDDADDDEDLPFANDDLPPAGPINQGVEIHEIMEEEPNDVDAAVEPEREDHEEDEELSDIDPEHNAIAEHEGFEGNIPESEHNRVYTYSIYPHALMSPTVDQNQDGTDRGKRKREDFVEESELPEKWKMNFEESSGGSGPKAEKN